MNIVTSIRDRICSCCAGWNQSSDPASTESSESRMNILIKKVWSSAKSTLAAGAVIGLFYVQPLGFVFAFSAGWIGKDRINKEIEKINLLWKQLMIPISLASLTALLVFSVPVVPHVYAASYFMLVAYLGKRLSTYAEELKSTGGGDTPENAPAT